MVELDNPLSCSDTSVHSTNAENRENTSSANVGNYALINGTFENSEKIETEIINSDYNNNSNNINHHFNDFESDFDNEDLLIDENIDMLPKLIKAEQNLNEQLLVNSNQMNINTETNWSLSNSGNGGSVKTSATSTAATVNVNYNLNSGNSMLPAAAANNSIDYTQQFYCKANLTAIKHDHPFANKVDLNDLINDEKLNDNNVVSSVSLVSRSNPQMPSATATANSLAMESNFDANDLFMKLPYCLPYGNCRDDGPPAKKFGSFIFDDDDWLLSNTIVNNEKDNDHNAFLNFNDDQFNEYFNRNEKPLKMEDAFQLDKIDLKSGPTLAELNFSGDLDYGDILLSYSNKQSSNQLNKQFACGQLPPLKKLKPSSPPLRNMEIFHSPIQEHQTMQQQQQQQTISSLNEVEQKPKENQEFFDAIKSPMKNLNSKTTTPTIVTTTTTVTPSMLTTSPAASFQTQIPKLLIKRPPGSLSPSDGSQAKMGATVFASKLRSSNSCVTAKAKTVFIQDKPSEMIGNKQTETTTVLGKLLNINSENKPMKKIGDENKQTTEMHVHHQHHHLQVPETNLKSRKRNNSMSTDCSFSSHDDEFDSESEAGSSDDESFYGDYDAKDLIGASTSDDKNNKWALNMGRSRKGSAQRYFWQYNIQSKGPKGTRIRSLEESTNDPHVLCEASDPVFSPDCHIEGVKHAGKARRGDGNDLTPNPKKLLMIGLELKKLSKTINDLMPVAEVPQQARNKSRKEKNKLASRACRLKKKAQHEANKIKLYGLQQEHKKIMTVIIELKELLKKSQHTKGIKLSYNAKYEQIVAQLGPRLTVAGRTTDFVNSVLDNVASGNSSGDLENL